MIKSLVANENGALLIEYDFRVPSTATRATSARFAKRVTKADCSIQRRGVESCRRRASDFASSMRFSFKMGVELSIGSICKIDVSLRRSGSFSFKVHLHSESIPNATVISVSRVDQTDYSE